MQLTGKILLAAATACVAMACGGNSWTDADTKAASDAVRAQRLLVTLCESDAGCTPMQTWIVEQSTSCNLASMLHRHGADDLIGDSGACK